MFCPEYVGGGALAALPEPNTNQMTNAGRRGRRPLQEATNIMSEENNQYTFENETYRRTYWHTCSHILAQAVKRL